MLIQLKRVVLLITMPMQEFNQQSRFLVQLQDHPLNRLLLTSILNSRTRMAISRRTSTLRATLTLTSRTWIRKTGSPLHFTTIWSTKTILTKLFIFSHNHRLISLIRRAALQLYRFPKLTHLQVRRDNPQVSKQAQQQLTLGLRATSMEKLTI